MIRITAILALLFASAASAAEVGTWKRLPDLPDPHGVAGSFAGVSGGSLIVAGGANFPEKKPWEGGMKVWHDSIFVLERPDGEWKSAGKLPRPLGYGVSVTYRDSLICVGGSNSEGHFADAFRLTWKEGRIITTPLPPLPLAIANACGALAGDRLYIGGGQQTPTAATALATLFELDLSADAPKWRECERIPGGGRILAVAAAIHDDLYVMGGAELTSSQANGKVERRYRKDAWRYRPGEGWAQLPDLPHAVVAAPSPAPIDGEGRILIFGGDDGSQVGVTPPQGHTGFSKSIFRFNAIAKDWEKLAEELPAPRVTVPCVQWNDLWIIPSGEMLPGVRSPQVWAFTPNPERH